MSCIITGSGSFKSVERSSSPVGDTTLIVLCHGDDGNRSKPIFTVRFIFHAVSESHHFLSDRVNLGMSCGTSGGFCMH